MKLEAVADIPFAREQVYAVYRDRLPQLVPYLPNIREIVQKSRTEEGHLVKVLNLWKGGGEIPAAARSVVSEKLLEWDDDATWDNHAFTCEWRIVTPHFKDAVYAAGNNTFEALGPDRTRLTIRGELTIDGARVPGVPKFLAKTVAPVVEKFLIAAIKPNLLEVSKGVERFLKEKGV